MCKVCIIDIISTVTLDEAISKAGIRFKTTYILYSSQSPSFSFLLAFHSTPTQYLAWGTCWKMSLPTPRLYNPTSDTPLLFQLAQIHADCITTDHQLAAFLPPLDHKRMVDYWTKISQRVEQGEVEIILQMASEEVQSGGDAVGEASAEVAGYVCLMKPWAETGPFRGIVEKLMVSPRHRRKGVARRVMGMLESVARERERFLLVCYH